MKITIESETDEEKKKIGKSITHINCFEFVMIGTCIVNKMSYIPIYHGWVNGKDINTLIGKLEAAKENLRDYKAKDGSRD